MDHARSDVDFAGLFNEFDTALVGRRRFGAMLDAGRATIPGMKLIVFSGRYGKATIRT